MKFKMQDKQYQLIEKVSNKHLVVGVDIAQQLHVARGVKWHFFKSAKTGKVGASKPLLAYLKKNKIQYEIHTK